MNLNELKCEVEDRAIEYLTAQRLDDLEEKALGQLQKTANNGYVRLHKLEFSALLSAVRGLHRKRQNLEAEFEKDVRSLPMHMYCWSKPPSFIAVAQAHSVTEARTLVLGQIGHGDGSCPEREKAAEWIKDNTPTIWHGPNAEFELTDSAELIEQLTFLETVQRDLKNTQRDYSELRDSFDKLRERTLGCPRCFNAGS